MSKREIPLIGPAIESLDAPTFKARLESLYEKTETEKKQPIQGLHIVFGQKTTVRSTRAKKELSMQEVHELAKFYERSPEELLQIFKKRKYTVT